MYKMTFRGSDCMYNTGEVLKIDKEIPYNWTLAWKGVESQKSKMNKLLKVILKKRSRNGKFIQTRR